jgi:hypothetical protein
MVNTTLEQTNPKTKKSRPPPPHERGERKRSKPALNGAFGLSGFFSPKGVVLLQFFCVLFNRLLPLPQAHIDPGSVREAEGHPFLKATLFRVGQNH